MNDLIFKEEVYAIVGAAFDVYNELGDGFLEAIYQEALELELSQRQIPHIALQELSVTYKGKPLKKSYIADFVAFGKIIVEIKAIEHLTDREIAQLLNYLKATGNILGLLINFGSKKDLEWKRVIFTPRLPGKHDLDHS